MIARMFLLPDVDVSHPVTKSMANLLKGLSGIYVIYNGYHRTLAFSLQHNVQLAIYFQISSFMPFQ